MHARVTLPAVVLLALAGCAGQAGRGTTVIPEPDSPGARVYVQRCSSCHALPHPQRLGYDGWLQILPLMERRMAERGINPLTGEERKEILVYLRKHAR